MSVGDILDREEDRAAYVRFEQRPVKDNEATLAAGHYVSKNVDYALITPPYSKDEVIKKVDVWFKQKEKDVQNGRVPERHLRVWKDAYKHWLEGVEPPVDGTSIKDWNALSPAQCQNLINAGCRTIEDLAQCNDEALRRLGMGGNDLKNRAIAWLQAAKDHGPLTEQVVALQRENTILQGSIDSLQEQIKLMQVQLEGQSESVSRETVIGNVVVPTALINEMEKTPTEQYIAKFGKKPHHLMKDETILKKLQE